MLKNSVKSYSNLPPSPITIKQCNATSHARGKHSELYLRYIDFINLMSYDFHGAWEDFTGMNSPLYSRSDEAPEFRQWNIVSYRNNYSVWTLKIRQ